MRKKKKSSNSLNYFVFLIIFGLVVWKWYSIKTNEQEPVTYSQQTFDSLNKIIVDCRETSENYNQKVIDLQNIIDTLRTNMDSIVYKIETLKNKKYEKNNTINSNHRVETPKFLTDRYGKK